MNLIARRVHRILTLLFSGVQQREAARRIGVTQSLLSRTLSGSREPSAALLKKLSCYPGVNQQWLFEGIGEPLDEACTSLPVILTIPETLESTWDQIASKTERFRISENQFSETRYWIRLTERTVSDWSFAEHALLRPMAGDYLLIETDPRQIQAISTRPQLVLATHPEINNGFLCWGSLLASNTFYPLVQQKLRLTKTSNDGKIGNRDLRVPFRSRRKFARHHQLDVDDSRSPSRSEMSPHPSGETARGRDEPQSVKGAIAPQTASQSATRTGQMQTYILQLEQIQAVVIELTTDVIFSKRLPG